MRFHPYRTVGVLFTIYSLDIFHSLVVYYKNKKGCDSIAETLVAKRS